MSETCRIEKLVQGGEGFAISPDGRALFVAGALPGELVEYQVTTVKPTFTKAVATNILEPSDKRVLPLCPLYGICGGCDLMHLDSQAQATAAQAIVTENLRRIGSIEVHVAPAVAGTPFGYRSRMRVHVDTRNKRLGFLAARSRELVDIRHCPVLVPMLDTLLDDGRKLLFEAAAQRGIRSKDSPYLQVPAFAGDGQVSLGNEAVAVTVEGHTLHSSASVFFQSNREALPQLVDFVTTHATGTHLMDLYSGVGFFSSFLEGAGKSITAVERDPKCLELARGNLHDTHFFTKAVEDWKPSMRGTLDTVVVDPPRVGLAPAVPAMIASWKPDTILYVSCDNVTLARDAKRFVQLGYTPTQVQVFDFYPQTSQIESAMVLKRN